MLITLACEIGYAGAKNRSIREPIIHRLPGSNRGVGLNDGKHAGVSRQRRERSRGQRPITTRHSRSTLQNTHGDRRYDLGFRIIKP